MPFWGLDCPRMLQWPNNSCLLSCPSCCKSACCTRKDEVANNSWEDRQATFLGKIPRQSHVLDEKKPDGSLVGRAVRRRERAPRPAHWIKVGQGAGCSATRISKRSADISVALTGMAALQDAAAKPGTLQVCCIGPSVGYYWFQMP